VKAKPFLSQYHIQAVGCLIHGLVVEKRLQLTALHDPLCCSPHVLIHPAQSTGISPINSQTFGKK